MKIIKLLNLLLIFGLVFSCSNDSLIDQESDDTSARITQNQFDNSHLGVYKGLFTTVDGLTRGSVVVTLLSSNEGNAQITLSSGEIIELKSSKVKMTADNTIGHLKFTSEGLSNISATLDFSVDGDGNNPRVSNVNFDNKESDILIAKNLSRAPLTTITGTYARTAGTGGFPNSGRTWNTMSIGEGNQTFAVQIAYGGRVYNTSNTSSTQSGCTASGGLTTCNITGSASILGYAVNWNGTHTYSNESNEICSSVSGVWSAPSFGNSSGTFQSDSDCTPAEVTNDLCADAIQVALGQTVTGSTTSATNTGSPSTSCNGNSLNTASGVWYKITGDGFPIAINTTGSTFDTQLAVFSGSCGALTCVSSNNDNGSSLQSSLNFLSTSGVNYYVLVTGNGAASGRFTLNLLRTPFTSTSSISCGGSVIDDGGANGSYSNNRYDVYYIDAGAGKKVSLAFGNGGPGFNLDSGDFLRVYNGNTVNSPAITTSTPAGGTATANGFTGGNVSTGLRNRTVVSTGRYMTVVFYSNDSGTSNGFNAVVSCPNQ